MHRVEVISLLFSTGLFGIVFELVRRRKILVKYSLLWFFTALVVALFTVRRDWLESVAHSAGIFYTPSALFLILNFFMISILIHFSMVISQLKNQTRILAQKVAHLQEATMQNEVENSQKKSGATSIKRVA